MHTSLSNTFFLTATINSWQKLLNTDVRKQVIIDSLKFLCENDKIKLHAFVIMPNHIHLILTLSENETQETFQRDFLKFTAQQLIKLLIHSNNLEELNHFKSTQKDRIYHIWERRPKWIFIENTLILDQKIDYLHKNPIQEKWHLSEREEYYQWSSASFYILENKQFEFITDYRDV